MLERVLNRNFAKLAWIGWQINELKKCGFIFFWGGGWPLEIRFIVCLPMCVIRSPSVNSFKIKFRLFLV